MCFFRILLCPSTIFFLFFCDTKKKITQYKWVNNMSFSRVFKRLRTYIPTGWFITVGSDAKKTFAQNHCPDAKSYMHHTPNGTTHTYTFIHKWFMRMFYNKSQSDIVLIFFSAHTYCYYNYIFITNLWFIAVAQIAENIISILHDR